MGECWLLNLIDRVHTALQQVCPDEEASRNIQPPECVAFFQPDNVSPFSLRHAMQQASIIGNAKRFGLLENEEQVTVVEFGAGKGYLSCMLSNCSNAPRFLLVDNQSFRRKAERFLRKNAEVERLRVDIKDFDPAGLPQLQAEGSRWVALGKHLCGAATDFTLRCCGRLAGGEGPPAAGLAVATCCHHRCSWEHYAGSQVFRELGFSPEDFEVISWMTGWALCGHEVPTGMAPDEPAALGATASHSRGRGKKQREAAARQRALEVLQQQSLGGDGTGEAVQSPDGGRMGEERSAEAEEDALPLLQRENGHGELEAQEGRFPAADIPRPARIAAGQECKRLIDHCRAEYLRRRGFKVEVVHYVPDAISGENRLLLAAPRSRTP